MSNNEIPVKDADGVLSNGVLPKKKILLAVSRARVGLIVSTFAMITLFQNCTPYQSIDGSDSQSLKDNPGGGTLPITPPPGPIQITEPGTEIVGLSFINRSANSQTERYVTFGHVFPEGDVGPNAGLVLKVNDMLYPVQIDKKASHPTTGSLRFGVLSVSIPNLAGSQSIAAKLVTTESPFSSPALTPQHILQNSSYDVVVSINLNGATYAASARDALTAAISAGQVETWLSGPFVSEFHVRAPLTANLGAEFDIRIHANGEIRTEVTVTNSFGFISGMAAFTYDVVVTQAGGIVYSKNGLKHFPYANWHKAFVMGRPTEIFVKRDRAYFARSRAVPNYEPTRNTSEDFLNSLQTLANSSDCGPMGSGTITHYMPTTGLRPDIGFLPGWDAAYFISMDPRAEALLLCNADAAASIPYHVAEKSTGRPFTIKDHPTIWLDGRGAGNPHRLAAPYDISSTPWSPDTAHMPNLGYSAYMITGNRVYFQEMLFQAAAALGMSWNYLREDAKGIVVSGGDQVRSGAWSLRTVANAAYLTPDSHPQKGYLNEIVETNLQSLIEYFASGPGSQQGAAKGYIYGAYRDGLAPWQQDYLAITIGQIFNRGVATARNVLQIQSNFVAGRFLRPDTEVCKFKAPAYALTVVKGDGKFMQSWQEIGTANNLATPCPTSFDVGGGNLAILSVAALATMVDAGIPEAVSAHTFVRANDPAHVNANSSLMTGDAMWAIAPLNR